MDDAAGTDVVLRSLYAVLSGRAGDPRDWDRFRGLFLKGARLVRTGLSAGGRPEAKGMDVEAYIADVDPYLRERDFHEHEIGRRQFRFGNIAHVLSAYEARHRPTDAAPFRRGVNSVQLYHDGRRWRIVSVLWDNERPGVVLPPDLEPPR